MHNRRLEPKRLCRSDDHGWLLGKRIVSEMPAHCLDSTFVEHLAEIRGGRCRCIVGLDDLHAKRLHLIERRSGVGLENIAQAVELQTGFAGEVSGEHCRSEGEQREKDAFHR